MSFTVIIPARLASTRLPNKPIADICGKPMIVRVAEQALKSGASRVICAVDDELILKACEANGIEACLTRKDHACGTDRLCEAAEVCKIPDDEIIVNVQGDRTPNSSESHQECCRTSDEPLGLQHGNGCHSYSFGGRIL